MVRHTVRRPRLRLATLTDAAVAAVEKDKQILRDLLSHAVRKNSLHGAQSLYRAIASPLQRGISQADCYRFMIELG